MKLIGNLKKQVEESTSREAKKAAIADAGMELTDDELDKVAGGYDIGTVDPIFSDDEIKCPECGEPYSNGRMTVEDNYKGVRTFHCPCGKTFSIYG